MRRFVMFAVVAAVVAGLTASAWAAPQAKKYQVTGPVIEIANGKIVIMKGDERWELATDKDTKSSGELKVGAKVTIEYQMYAATVSVKDSGEAKAEPKKDDKK
jgi:hypothetical protein